MYGLPASGNPQVLQLFVQDVRLLLSPLIPTALVLFAVKAPSRSTGGASILSKNPIWNFPARGTDELVPAARNMPRSSASGVEGAQQRKLLPYANKVTRETDVKQSKQDSLSSRHTNPT